VPDGDRLIGNERARYTGAADKDKAKVLETLTKPYAAWAEHYAPSIQKDEKPAALVGERSSPHSSGVGRKKSSLPGSAS
jgi:hypothetical protein